MSTETPTPPPEGVFTDYFRMIREERSVATITRENIAALAAWLRVSVDYSKERPALLIPSQARDAGTNEPVERVERYEVGERVVNNSTSRTSRISRDYGVTERGAWQRVES